jgi:hypothetical protein
LEQLLITYNIGITKSELAALLGVPEKALNSRRNRKLLDTLANVTNILVKLKVRKEHRYYLLSNPIHAFEDEFGCIPTLLGLIISGESGYCLEQLTRAVVQIYKMELEKEGKI